MRRIGLVLGFLILIGLVFWFFPKPEPAVPEPVETLPESTPSNATSTKKAPRPKAIRDGAVNGFVVDEADQPLPGARIRSGEIETRSDARGAFALKIARNEANPTTQLEASLLGYALTMVTCQVGSDAAPTSIRIQLKRGLGLNGLVRSSLGAPIANAQIHLYQTSWQGQQVLLKTSAAETDEHGHFELESVPSGAALFVVASGYSSLFVTELQPETPLACTLVPLQSLRGRVVNAETGLAIQKFRLLLTQDHLQQDPRRLCPEPTRFDLIDTGGHFDLPDLHAELSFTLRVRADGYEELVLPQQVADGTEQELRLNLAKGILRVQALNSFEKPIPNLNVCLLGVPGGSGIIADWALYEARKGPGPFSFKREGRTKATGEVSFEGLPDHTDLSLYVFEGEWARTQVAVPASALSSSELFQVFVPVAGSIFGKLDHQLWPEPRRLVLSNGGLGLSLPLDLPADGAFRFPSLAPAAYQVLVFSGSGKRLLSQRVVVSEGEDVALELLPPSGWSLTGWIRDADGFLAGASVLVHGKADDRFLTQTNEEGFFQVDGLSRNAYKLGILRGALPSDAEITGFQNLRQFFAWHGPELDVTREAHGSEDQTFTLVSNGSLLGQLIDRPSAGVVSLDRLGAFAAVDSKGYFKFQELGPGTYRLVDVLPDGSAGKILSEPIVMPAGEDLDLGLVPRLASGRLRVVVSGANEPYLVAVHAMVSEDDTPLAQISDGRRPLELELPAEEVSVKLTTDNAILVEPADQIVQIHENRTAEVAFQLKRLNTLSIEVNQAQHLPLRVSLAREGGEALKVERGGNLPISAQDPRWKVYLDDHFLAARGLQPGSWRAVVTYEDGQTWETLFQLDKDQNLRLQAPSQ